MISFHPDFVKTRYTGYLWNTREKRLYTLKVTGVLRPLTRYEVWFNRNMPSVRIPHYTISVNNRKFRWKEEDIVRVGLVKDKWY